MILARRLWSTIFLVLSASMTMITIGVIFWIVKSCIAGQAAGALELVAFGLIFEAPWIVVNALLIPPMIKKFRAFSRKDAGIFTTIFVLLYYLINLTPKLLSSMSETKFLMDGYRKYHGDMIAMNINRELYRQHVLDVKVVVAIIGIVALIAFMILNDSSSTTVGDTAPK